MKDNVLNWLKNGANAQEGVHLMEQAGATSLTLRLVRSNPLANKRLMVDYLCRQYNIQEDYSVAAKQPDFCLTKKTTLFRKEFPFLNDKSCPVELETLASRKFADYYRYVDLHAELKHCTSLEECAKVSKEVIDSYIDNRQIWEELNYYKTHKALLGKHPIFQEFTRRRRLLQMSIKELVYRKQQIENNIWRVKNELARGDKPHLDNERKARLAGYESELEELNRLLG